MTCCAIVPAAGGGRRFGGDRSKQFVPILGRPLLAWTVERLLAAPEVDRVVVAAPPGRAVETMEMLLREVRVSRDVGLSTVEGGRRRQDSVRAALVAAELAPTDWVAVHDGARPCLATADLAEVLRSAAGSGGVGAVLGRPVSDTLKTTGDGRLSSAVDRSGLFRAETPQVFRAGALREALGRAERENLEVSDESSLFAPGSVAAVGASQPNPKLTDASDLPAIEALLRREHRVPNELEAAVGHGYDVHPLRAGRPLILGGQRIPNETGLDGHSDADVVLHAIGDALLGAAGLGDLGVHFSPSDEAWRGADSSDLLRRIVAMVLERGFAVRNCDVTLIAERPSMAPYRSAIEEHVAGLLRIEPERMNFKATTHEGLGPLGRGEGMAAHASVLIERARAGV
ncbi:MAG: 2-C-methyl-D-erythritol 2,4-cyclodiphosphate synthase [Acidobacteria bacterium]|nr:2-C-methyl-D-erythritol 2,4-cyclodiphosphate synthase [Acidobacteriota bacterium]